MLIKKLSLKKNLSAYYRSLIKHVFIGSWWVIAFIILCIFLFEKNLENRAELFNQLSQQFVSLQNEKEVVLKQQQDLERQILSQNDLSWIELVLMKGLGLVPEGQQKVYFYPDDVLN